MNHCPWESLPMAFGAPNEWVVKILGKKTWVAMMAWDACFSSKIPCEVKIFGKDRGRLKRFLPQLRAAGLRSINLSRVPQSTEELNMFGICRPGQMKIL